MSAIFGIFHRDGMQAAPSELETMRSAMAYWGPHGSSVWQAENIGLGHLLLHNTAEARCESLPLKDPASGCVLTAHARIDNRDELISALGLEDNKCNPQSKIENRKSRQHADKSKITDSDLILHAYLRWREECVHHLIGDWAFAVWDPKRRRLFIARDHYGISGIYYYRGQRFFAFASCVKGLLALPQVPRRPNLFRVAQILTSWPGDGVQTAYEEIFRLPPAHTLTVTADRVMIGHYWYLEDITPLRLGSDGEYLEAFLEVYTQAVRCRLRSLRPVGATLSSGLDSGSVCALAARELSASGRQLPVFTSVPVYDTRHTTRRGRYGDESPLVEFNRRFIDNLDVRYIRAEDVSPLMGMERELDLHDEPGHAAGNMFWIHALMETAKEQGLGALLTGQCGNATISWTGGVESFWPLILLGHWRTLYSKFSRNELAPWGIIKRHLLRPVILPMRYRMERYRHPGREPWAGYSAINLQFARSLQLMRRMHESGHDPTFTSLSRYDPIQLRCRIIGPGSSIVGAIWAEDGAGYGLEARDPTMDKRLMEFCLAVPDEQYRLNGQDRSFIRRAMKGILPDEVRLNTRRGLQAADLGHRLLATLPEVQAMMARLERSALAREVLDLAKMNRVLQALQKEVNVVTTEECGTILARGMMAGMFLLRF
jgi:asparagine synthase (glutamine-hydrolysing)